MFRILHLSDLHARDNTSWSTLPILREAKNTILQAANAHNIDLVAFTGDIAFSGKKDEYRIAQEWIDDLCLQPSGLNIDKGQVVFVPGNHDVNRTLISPAASAIETELAKATTQAAVSYFYEDSDSRQILLKRLDGYRDFCASFLGEAGGNHMSWSKVFKHSSGRIRVDGLNTSWLCRGDNDHRRLLIGQSQITDLIRSTPDDADLRITLMHHPLQDLMEFDEENTGDYLKQNSQVVLRGHLHKVQTTNHISNTGSILEVAAGALHTTHESHNRFSLIDINDDLSSLRISTYVWVSGRWILDRNIFQTPDGVGEFPLDGKSRVHNFTHSRQARPHQLESTERGGSISASTASDSISRRSIPSNVQRFQYISTAQDLWIRQRELEAALQQLRSTRRLVLQKEAGSKHEGFLATLLAEVRAVGPRPDLQALLFKCSGVTSGKQLQQSIELAVGTSITDFGGLLRDAGDCLVIFEDLDFTSEDSVISEPTVESTLDALHDFCPQVLVVRTTVLPCPAPSVAIRIGALDVGDMRSYLLKASKPVQLSSPTDYSRVHRVTGGLPIYLDDFIKAIDVADLDGAIAQVAVQPVLGGDSLHDSIIREIDALRQSSSDEMQRVRSLLWTLAILEQGESLSLIKRLDGHAPIWPAHATYLQTRGCLESAAISSTLAGSLFSSTSTSGDKILRIPKVVRGYVLSIMQADERQEIIKKVAKLYFSDDWRLGTVRMRRRVAIGSEITTHQSGNELSILRALLRSPEAFFVGSTPVAFRLALSYVAQLKAKALFGEAYEAAKDTLALVDDLQTLYAGEQIYQVQRVAATCARMLGEREECVEYLANALPPIRAAGVKAVLTDALVDYALALKSLGRRAEAKAAADEIVKVAPKDSSDYLQAKATLAEITLPRVDALKILKPLANRARNLGHHTVADNVTLEVASDNDNSEEKLKLLTQVKSRRELGINFVRATISRVETLLQMNRLSELTSLDRDDLVHSYRLAYSQRLALFDWCHRVYWRYLAAVGERTQLVDLYVYSSFVWRLNGDSSTELEFSTSLQGALVKETRFDASWIVGYLLRRVSGLKK